MRMVTFIFALSFLTTLGWKVHSTLTDWSTPVSVSFAPIHHLVTVAESQKIILPSVKINFESENNYFTKIDNGFKKEFIALKKITAKPVVRVEIYPTKIKFEKTKFGLPENEFENIEYKIRYYKDIYYNYIAFEFKQNDVEQVIHTIAAKSIAVKSEETKTTKVEKDEELEEDLKIFEYSKADVEEVTNPLMNTQKPVVSENVDRAIQREMVHQGQKSHTAEEKPEVKKIVAESVGSIGPQKQNTFNISEINEPAPMGPLAMNTVKQVNGPIKNNQTQKQNENNFVSTQELLLRSGRVDFSGNEMSIQRFELIPFDDENEIISADSEGILRMTMAEGQNRLVSVRANGYLSTNLKISSNTADTTIPLLAQSEFEVLLNRFKLRGEGAFLAVQLDDEIKNVVLDKPFEAKLFLDRSFKIVAQDKDPQFVLFIGIAPGNTMIGYDFSNDKKINKIIYLAESELYFDNEEFSKSTNFDFSIYTKELMGQGKTPLNISGELVASFNDNQESKKVTLNSYGFKDIVSGKNESNYFELRLPDHNIFFTALDGAEVELPSKTYYNEILAQFNLDKLKESCVIQLNINHSKKLELIKLNGRSHQGFENIELIALDNDGSLGSEVSDTTKKVFLSGNAQGVINLKLKYTDSTIDFHQTFCSPGIYLVEHL